MTGTWGFLMAGTAALALGGTFYWASRSASGTGEVGATSAPGKVGAGEAGDAGADAPDLARSVDEGEGAAAAAHQETDERRPAAIGEDRIQRRVEGELLTLGAVWPRGDLLLRVRHEHADQPRSVLAYEDGPARWTWSLGGLELGEHSLEVPSVGFTSSFEARETLTRVRTFLPELAACTVILEDGLQEPPVLAYRPVGGELKTVHPRDGQWRIITIPGKIELALWAADRLPQEESIFVSPGENEHVLDFSAAERLAILEVHLRLDDELIGPRSDDTQSFHFSDESGAALVPLSSGIRAEGVNPEAFAWTKGLTRAEMDEALREFARGERPLPPDPLDAPGLEACARFSFDHEGAVVVQGPPRPGYVEIGSAHAALERGATARVEIVYRSAR